MQDDLLDAHLGHAVVRMFRLMNRVFNRALAEHDISAEQAHVLSMLWTFGPLAMGELQQQLALSSATLTGAIDRMERDKLVARTPDADDKRTIRVEARVAAKQRAKIAATVDTAERRCFAGLDDGERATLARLLAKCIADLEPAAQAR